jgi:glycosyltransferase involved in cell wall biosynthesis
MKVLVAHNHYQQAGGEDTVFAAEVQLLREGGHSVETLTVSNDGIAGPLAQAKAALFTPYSPEGRKLMTEAIAAFRPDVVHVHNFFPRLSPSVFDACHAAGVPSVLTLHNFRTVCANAMLMREGQVCELCVGHMPLPAVAHRCYRGSAVGSLALATSIWVNQARGMWRSKVTRFIALNDFARRKFVAAGFPAARLVVKPNFVADPRNDVPAAEAGVTKCGALFVGRLSPEKGVDVLIDAWKNLDIPLTILGDGPERARLERVAGPAVRFAGHRDKAFVQAAMRSAALVIVPSIWFEMFPMTIVEAMANGTPVAASRIGALEEVVTDGETGLHFAPGDAADLAAVVTRAFAAPDLLEELSRKARAYYETELSPTANLSRIEAIYADARGELVA